ncbi:serpentine type 7TM GPCR chemoreceptor srd domain-containing protein [Ditylenchus destructor]|uniref:Serpentine type 7TM GPCR chemoreceptor srd domain-containing protein n=1 Tax=Ditylenchus destructor TaxID=166010 RepID=A0AAD4MZ36_9BILA|nr:serpentine type 7TM GPCR chemoreceptor srd domain-containing protein [Ditylenchus destructor]
MLISKSILTLSVPDRVILAKRLIYCSSPILKFMLNIGTLQEVNCWLCAILGIFFNSLLIWMIVYRSVAEIRPYSRILLQTCVIDIYTVVTMIVVQPAILPCVGSLVSLIAMLTTVLVVKASSVNNMAYITMPVHWIPVLNPVITIFVVGSYRRVVFKNFTVRNVTNEFIGPTQMFDESWLNA